MNMKKIVIYLTVTMTICFIVGLTIIHLTGGFKNLVQVTSKNNKEYSFNNDKKYNVNEEKNMSINKINAVLVKDVNSDINIIPEDRKDLKIRFYGEMNTKNKPQIITKIENDKLIITTTKNENKVNINIGNYSSNIDIYIPSSYTGDLNLNSDYGDLNVEKNLTLKSLDVDMKSGDGNISNITTNDLMYKSSYGSLELKNINSKNIDIEMTSGDGDINNLVCDKLTYRSSYGSLDGENINSNDSDIDMKSGDIELSKFCGNLSGSSSYGDTDIEYLKFDNNINFNSSSGNIMLNLPKNSQFYLDGRCDSGEITCDFPITINAKDTDSGILKGFIKSDKNKIMLNSNYGDIEINNS